MAYRRLMLIFAVFILHGTTVQVYTASPETELDWDKVVEIDGKKITRRGVVNDIGELLDGVVDITGDILHVLLAPIKQLIKLDQEAIVYNAHKQDVASVRLGGPICNDEMLFRRERFPVVKQAQEKLLGMELEDEDVLEIGFSGSGGGMRAKTYSLGACVGADKEGLLDAIMYMSGLSGSTWFLGPWISSGLPIQSYRERALQDCVNGMDIKDPRELGPMIDTLWVKFAYNQPINIMDAYGALLANSFLRDYDQQAHLIYLSQQAAMISRGDCPMPVYTAVLAERNMAPYWFEYTPYEVGSRWLGAYAPSWAFGRQFKKGSSKECAPEMSLGFQMATFGSAFAASFREAYDAAIKNAPLPGFLKGVPLADKIWVSIKKAVAQALDNNQELGDVRLAWVEVFNYTYKMKNAPYNEYRDLKLADGGVYFNNPIFGVYRKPPYGEAPDVIFVLDSGSAITMDEMNIASNYAVARDIPFPIIDRRDDIATKSLHIFGDPENLDVPLVLYMPRVGDSALIKKHLKGSGLSSLASQLKDFDVEEAVSYGFAATFNFAYTYEQGELIANLAEFNMRANMEEIRDLLRQRVEAKRAHKMHRSFLPKRAHKFVR